MDATRDTMMFWCCDCAERAHPRSEWFCDVCTKTSSKKRPNWLDYCKRPPTQALSDFLGRLPIRDDLFPLLRWCGIVRPRGVWGGQALGLLLSYVNTTARLPPRHVVIKNQQGQERVFVIGVDDFAREVATRAPPVILARVPDDREQKAAEHLVGLSRKRHRDSDEKQYDAGDDAGDGDGPKRSRAECERERARADKLLTCLKCSRLFDFVDRLPHLVHACGHTFCQSCISTQSCINGAQACWTCRAAWPLPIATTVNQGVQDAMLLRRRSAAEAQTLSVHALVHVSDASVEQSFLKTRIRLASMRASAGLDVPALLALDAAFLDARTEELRAWCLYGAVEVLTKLRDDLATLTKLVVLLQQTEQAESPLYQSLILLAESQAPQNEIDAELELLLQSPNKTVKSRAHLARGFARKRRGQTAKALEDFQTANDLGSDVAAWYALQLYNVCRLPTPLSLWAHWGLLYERLRRLSPSGYTYGWVSVLLANACWHIGRNDAARQLAQRALTVEREMESARAGVVFRSSELKDVKLTAPFWAINAKYIMRVTSGPRDQLPRDQLPNEPDVFRDRPSEWINFCQQVGLQINDNVE